MTVEDIAVARAEEQLRAWRPLEPTTHDRWRIRVEGREEKGVRVFWRREFCLACGKKTWRGTSYCERHACRVQRGDPVDLDDFPTWSDYRRLCRGASRFGYVYGAIRFGGGK